MVNSEGILISLEDDPVLVFHCCGHSITKAASERKHLTGGLLTVSEDESMTIMVGSMAAGRHGARNI